MEQSQLVELINSLSLKEREQALQFASISFYPEKMKTYVCLLLDQCLSHPWDDLTKTLAKEDIYKKVFPGQAFVKKKLEKVMVEALKVIRNFLLVQEYLKEENEFVQIHNFTEILRKRGFDTRYRNSLAKLKKEHEGRQEQHNLFFHEQFLLEYAIHNDKSYHNQVKGDLNIPNTLDALEMHLHLNRLALLNVYLLQQKAANIDVSETMLNRIEDPNVPSRYLEQSPWIKINYAIFHLLKKADHGPEDVQVLFDLLRKHEGNLPGDVLRDFYTYLRNICVLVLLGNPDEEDISNLLYQLYKDNLERGYLHYEGKIQPGLYLAISECAGRSKKFEWALEFIEKYKDDIIGENETRDIYRLNLAHYYFGVKKYSECLDNIPATSANVSNLLASKRLELKALYELQSDLLHYKLDAFKMFLSRTSQKLLPKARRQANVEFVNLLFQMKSIIPGDRKKGDRFLKRVTEKKHSAERRWLLEKARYFAGKQD